MSTQKSKSEYLVLCRGISWDEVLSPEEIEKALGSFYAWFERLSNEGKMRMGKRLEHKGKIVPWKSPACIRLKLWRIGGR
jgi:hypothetical protein